MPTRSTLTLALVLAGIICGAALVRVAHAGAADLEDLFAPGWMRGEVPVEPRDLVPDPGPARPGHGPAKRPLVTLRPSAPVVAVGAPISFEVGSSVNGFGHIYVISPSGRVQVWVENMPISAGQRLVFPTGRMGIRAAPPEGREELILIVTRRRIDGFLGLDTTSSPRELSLEPHAFKRALTEMFIDRPHREWGYARTSVQVVDRSNSDSPWRWGAGGSNAWADRWETE
jgi:uncharacterized protein DUF4384